eukprot:1648734-Pleurochrysis_carterae.AAC.4
MKLECCTTEILPRQCGDRKTRCDKAAASIHDSACVERSFSTLHTIRAHHQPLHTEDQGGTIGGSHPVSLKICPKISGAARRTLRRPKRVSRSKCPTLSVWPSKGPLRLKFCGDEFKLHASDLARVMKLNSIWMPNARVSVRVRGGGLRRRSAALPPPPARRCTRQHASAVAGWLSQFRKSVQTSVLSSSTETRPHALLEKPDTLI